MYVHVSGAAKDQLRRHAELAASRWAFTTAVLATIEAGVQWPADSFPIRTSSSANLRGLRLGHSPTGEQLLAVFTPMAEEDVPSDHDIGHHITAIITEGELEDYVEQNDVELRIEE